MAAKDLKKIKIFKETGLFEVKSRRRKKSIALTSVEDMATRDKQWCANMQYTENLRFL